MHHASFVASQGRRWRRRLCCCCFWRRWWRWRRCIHHFPSLCGDDCCAYGRHFRWIIIIVRELLLWSESCWGVRVFGCVNNNFVFCVSFSRWHSTAYQGIIRTVPAVHHSYKYIYRSYTGHSTSPSARSLSGTNTIGTLHNNRKLTGHPYLRKCLSLGPI